MADLVVKITGDTAELTKSLGEVAKVAGPVGEAINAGMKIAAAAIVAVTAAVTYGIEKFKEQEKAVNSLNAALANQGMYTDQLSNSYQEMAKQIQQTTVYSDDQVIRAQAIIQGLIGQHEVTQELIKATTDLAAAKGIDLASAAELVGRTIGTETNALTRQGVVVSAAADTSTKLVTVTKALETAFGGQAEAQAKGTGIIVQMKNSMDDMFKLIGEKAMPAITPLIEGMKEMFDTLANSKDFKKFLSDAFGAMKSAFEQMGALMETFADNFGSISHAMGLLWKAIWDKETAVKSFEEAWAAIKAVHQKAFSEYRSIREDQLSEDEKQEDSHNKAVVKNNTDAQNDSQKKQTQMEAEFEKKKFELKKQNDQRFYDDEKKFGVAYATLNEGMHSEIYQGNKKAFGDLAELQQSSNSTLKGIGKAAAIANIIIKTAESAMEIYAGFSTIPIVGPVLGVAGAAAAVAFGSEQLAKVNSANLGGIIPGAGPNQDSVLSYLTPGEFVVPRQNYNEVVDAVADKRAGGGGSEFGGMSGSARILIGFEPEAARYLTIKQNENRALGISLETV